MRHTTIDISGLRHLLRSRRGETQHCKTEGCPRATREGKPFCSEHVEQHPYVAGLIERLAQREAEEAKVHKQGARAVSIDGLAATEIMQHLSFHGGRTVERLSRELNMEVKTLQGYVSALKRKRLVSLTRNKRGSTVVTPQEGEQRSEWLREDGVSRN
jgi:predicted transcriptional regulator